MVCYPVGLLDDNRIRQYLIFHVGAAHVDGVAHSVDLVHDVHPSSDFPKGREALTVPVARAAKVQ